MKPRTGVVAGLVLVGLCAVAVARPGGGESYSGGGGHASSSGGSSSSHGGGGGIGALIDLIRLVWYIVELCIYHPFIGLPIVGGVVGLVAWSKYKDWKNRDWNSGPPVALARAIDLAPLRRDDAAFSQPVFEDFVYRLYAAAHLAKHDPAQLATLACYLAEDVRDKLARRVPNHAPIRGVVVGAQRVIALETRTPKTAITVEFEANLACDEETYFVVDRFTFVRDKGVPSKPPSPVRVRRCPNCDAPWAAKDTGSSACASCGQSVDAGRFAWFVAGLEIRSTQKRLATLAETVEERGNDLPTYRAPDVAGAMAQLAAADPATTEAALQQRIALIFQQLYAAWARNDIAPARGLVTDGLYDYLTYWLEVYRKQHVRNALEGMQLTRCELAKASRDAYYDAVTFRIWGSGRDYVVDLKTNDVVRGKPNKNRKYTEYWTLIRAAGRTGAPKLARRCPNCDGDLEITQSGECKFCNAHVTAGEFDWVLSKIEQDDSYRG